MIKKSTRISCDGISKGGWIDVGEYGVDFHDGYGLVVNLLHYGGTYNHAKEKVTNIVHEAALALIRVCLKNGCNLNVCDFCGRVKLEKRHNPGDDHSGM